MDDAIEESGRLPALKKPSDEYERLIKERVHATSEAERIAAYNRSADLFFSVLIHH